MLTHSGILNKVSLYLNIEVKLNLSGKDMVEKILKNLVFIHICYLAIKRILFEAV
ncbi:hypothetical protein Ctha_2677 [Chloroherpeton thalassium ATCC 35110]|uniref:Uncharacterized protein n=1 Tax=Chloroherpeton thalassium (strain ATCC 35110 / GB-78) TaxID=517418 RepID=B3QYQ3_CHLT3|nr:hypothetical protein Ctha_2677 [Chloroherpeton thalassium ATCC 35110]